MRTTLLLLLAGSALAGCARTVEIVRREPGPAGGATGRGAEVVFAGAAIDPGAEGWDFDRRDASLTARGPVTVVDAGWQSVPRPSLDYARRLYLEPGRQAPVTYFGSGPGPASERRGWRPWWSD